MKLTWVRRADRYFADGVKTTYRVRPFNGAWVFDVSVEGSGWTEEDTCPTPAAAKRAAQSWEEGRHH